MHVFTEADFDSLSFHDNLLRGFLLRSDCKERSDLILDIDHITEEVFANGQGTWLIAAADLIFHGVTGLKFKMDWRDESCQVSREGDWIGELSREPVVPQLVYLDRPYWHWSFSFDRDTTLSFGAYGFTLRLRQEPIRHNEASLLLAMRV